MLNKCQPQNRTKYEKLCVVSVIIILKKVLLSREAKWHCYHESRNYKLTKFLLLQITGMLLQFYFLSSMIGS